MKSEIEAALKEITSSSQGGVPQCWAYHLSGDALDFVRGLEQLEIEGQRVRRSVAADKLKELFPEFDISPGMISNHLIKACTCHRYREYGWENEK